MRIRLIVLMIAAGWCTPLLAQTTTTIDFEQFTSAPSVFTGVQPPLTIGIATFSGGQVLNATTFLPADQSVVYGTSYFCSGCLPTITIDFSQPVSNFSALVLNGQTFTVTYTVGDNVGDMQTITLVANFLSGAGTVTLPSANIRQVTLTSNTGAWDFFIDNVTFRQCSVTAVRIQTNPACDPSLSPPVCSANIVQANGSETTGIKTSVEPAQAISVNESADFGSPDSPVLTDPDGTVVSNYTAGSLSFGSTSTTVANVSATACGSSFSNLAKIFNYDGFDFHESQVSDLAFVDAAALSESQIEAFFVAHNSFLAHFILVGTIGGFEDLDGNGVLDPGEPVYQAGRAPIPLHSRGTSAAGIFAREAVGQGVNPKVLLATAQKESGLISRAVLPTAIILNLAMGCGATSNFVAQVHCAAATFINQFTSTPSEPFFFTTAAGIQHFVTGSGRQPVGFQSNTAATYAQYKYTPFIQANATGGGVYLFEKVWTGFGF